MKHIAGVPVDGTYWNGEPAEARIVRVIVGKAELPTYWYAELEGTEREVVEVKYGDQTFYLDNEDGSGWFKVTLGRGSPRCYHASLAIERIIE
jgi:hypothetical protein